MLIAPGCGRYANAHTHTHTHTHTHIHTPPPPPPPPSMQPADTSFAHVTTDGVHAKDRFPSAAAAAGCGAPSVLSDEQVSEGLKRLKPVLARCLIDSLGMDQCLIFCRTNIDCDALEAYFTAVGGFTLFYCLYSATVMRPCARVYEDRGPQPTLRPLLLCRVGRRRAAVSAGPRKGKGEPLLVCRARWHAFHG
jgi:hypothetical protein